MVKKYRRIYVSKGVCLSQVAVENLREMSDCALAFQQESDLDEVMEDCDALVASWGDTLNRSFLDRFPKLRYIGLRCTATENVDLEYLSGRGVEIGRLGRWGDFGTCEFVMQQLLCEMRGNTSNTKSVRQREIHGKTLGIVGFGGVGQLVAAAALGFGMEVIVVNRSGRPDNLGVHLSGCRFGSIADVMQNSDFVSFHTPPYRRVAGAHDLIAAKDGCVIFVTTLGLPFDMEDAKEFLVGSLGRRCVADLCAAGEFAGAALPDRFEVLPVYSARTQESIVRAEGELVRGFKLFLGGGDE